MSAKKERHGWFSPGILQPLDWLLLAVPIVFTIRYVPAWKNETVLFIITGLAIIPLAGWMGQATEHLGARAGHGIGGLLNAKACSFTGAINLLARRMIRFAGAGELRQLLTVMLVVSPISIFINLGGLERKSDRWELLEVVVGPNSDLIGGTLQTTNFRHRYNCTVIAIRQRGQLIRQRLGQVRLHFGDRLLLRGSTVTLAQIKREPNFIVGEEVPPEEFRTEKIPVALAIVGGVVIIAALGQPIVVMVPVAVATATTLGLDPKAFILAIMFAASTNFSTPVGYQTNTMIYGPGGYKFSDFIKVGVPLNLLLAIVTPLYIYLVWGL